jgi:hypothetical protein
VPEPIPNPGEILLTANDFYRRPPEHSVPPSRSPTTTPTAGSRGTTATQLPRCSPVPVRSRPEPARWAQRRGARFRVHSRKGVPINS